MLEHLRVAHDWRKPRRRTEWRKEPSPWKKGLWVQSFFPASGVHYFEVTRNENRNERSMDDTNLTRGERFRQQLRANLERREMELRSNAELIQTSSIRTEISLWQEKTRWIEHLSGRNLIVMARLVELPEGEDLRLQTICESLDRLLDGARKAVLDRKINYFDSKQINSFMRYKVFPKPLNVKILHSTFQRYKSIFKRLICYVLRTCDPSMSTRPLYKATNVQKRRLSDVMHAAELARNAPEYDPAHPHIIRTLDRCLLQLCIELLDHQLYGDEYESAIISFLAVWGINPKEEISEIHEAIHPIYRR